MQILRNFKYQQIKEVYAHARFWSYLATQCDTSCGTVRTRSLVFSLRSLSSLLIISFFYLYAFFQKVDGLQELEKGKKSLGTTKKGIGPAYSSKANRSGLRVADLIGDYSLFTEK